VFCDRVGSQYSSTAAITACPNALPPEHLAALVVDPAWLGMRQAQCQPGHACEDEQRPDAGHGGERRPLHHYPEDRADHGL